jgi:hypothetical protein
VLIAPCLLFNIYVRWRSMLYLFKRIIIYLYLRGIINV